MIVPEFEYNLTDGIPVLKITGTSDIPFVIRPVMIHFMSRLYYIIGMYSEESKDDLSPLLCSDLESMISHPFLKSNIMPFIWECAGMPSSIEIPDDTINNFVHDLGEWFALNKKEEL